MANGGTEHRKLAAIMFTDMVGYSALAQRDEALALALLEEHRRLLRSLFPKHQGTEIKTMGDGFLVEFDSALAAVKCAIEIQVNLARRNHGYPLAAPEQSVAPAGTEPSRSTRPILLRIGIHVGDVVRHENDVFGDGVNIAARIEPLAKPGGICISQDVVRHIEGKIKWPLLKLGHGDLKNIQASINIYRVILPWEKRTLPWASRLSFAFQQRRMQWLAFALGTLVLFAGLRFLQTLTQRSVWENKAEKDRVRFPHLSPMRIAVLPLNNFSSDKENDYFADQMTEELSSKLANIGGLRIIARTSVMKYKNTRKDIAEIGRELDVGTVIEGSVSSSSNRIRITIQVIETRTQEHLWSADYEQDFKNVFAVQKDVAQKVAEKLKVSLLAAERQRLEKKPTENLEAYILYLKGRDFWNRRTAADLKQGINSFQEAVRKDPRFALGYTGLADSYSLLCLYGELPPKEGFPLAKAAAQKAYDLDNTLPEAQTSLAFIKHYYDWDWAGAGDLYQRALDLNPQNSTAHHWHAVYLAQQGQFAYAIKEAKIALELEPFSPTVNSLYGWILYLARQYDPAIEQLQKTLRETGPDYRRAHLLLGWAYTEKKDYERAIAEFSQTRAPGEELPEPGLAYVQALLGQKPAAEKILALLDQDQPQRPRPSYDIAMIKAALGNRAEAFARLQNAIEEKSVDVVLLKVDPTLAGLHGDPKFTALLRRIGLAP